MLEDLPALGQQFCWPLFRLLLGLGCGLLLANLLEALRWSRQLAHWAFPLAKLAHLSPVAASAFALAFVSPAAANGLLSEKHQAGCLDKTELMLANLFNGLPAYLSHTPTLFLLTWPVLGSAAGIYVGLTLLAALLRTGFTIGLGRLLLPTSSMPAEAKAAKEIEPFGSRLKIALRKAWQRFCKRMPKLVFFTVPIYLLMFIGQRYGFFAFLEGWLASHLEWLTFLKPQAMSIIVMQLLAEMGATLGAAGAALADGSLTEQEVVLAMLMGNLLATPLRALRHQLPAYAGFYKPALALRLVCANQALRAASMSAVIAIYLRLAG